MIAPEPDDGGGIAPEPDAAAFANLIVCGACVAALGFLAGVDPWATLFPASATAGATALALGLAASPFHAAFLLLARSLACGGQLWWAEVEGQGALAELPAGRALAWACAVALADGAAMRGLVLPWISRLVTAPAGVDLAQVARRAAALPAVEALLKPAADADAAAAAATAAAAASGALAAASPSGAAALLAAGLGSPVAPVPLPASWLLPVVALAAGAATAALACFEPPAGIRVGFTARPGEPEPSEAEAERPPPDGDGAGEGAGPGRAGLALSATVEVRERPPEGSNEAYTMREILWAYWGDGGEESDGEEGEEKEEKAEEKGEQEGAVAAAAAAAAANAAAGKAESSESSGRDAAADDDHDADDVSLGDLLSNPLAAVAKIAADYTEDELADLFARSVASTTKIMGAVDRVTGGAFAAAVLPPGGLDEARRELVENAIAEWKQSRSRSRAGASSEAGAGTATEAALDSPDFAAKVFRRIKEREAEEASKKLKERERRRGPVVLGWNDGSGSGSEGGGGGGGGEGPHSSSGSGSGGVVRRWPRVDGPLRQWKVPLLVGLEGAALAALTLATHSVLAAAVAQAVGLFSLALVERKEKEKGRGGASAS